MANGTTNGKEVAQLIHNWMVIYADTMKEIAGFGEEYATPLYDFAKGIQENINSGVYGV